MPACHCVQPADLAADVVCRGKTNFFEKRVGEYQKNGVMAGLNKDSSSHGFSMDNDF